MYSMYIIMHFRETPYIVFIFVEVFYIYPFMYINYILLYKKE